MEDRAKIKILHLRSSGWFYGAEAVIVSLAKEQIRQGVDVVVGVIKSEKAGQENALAKRCEEEGIPVKEFYCGGKIDRNAIKEIREYLVANRIDVLHSHGYKADLFAFLAGKKLGVKKISTVHGYIVKSLKVWIYEFVDTYILKRFFDEIVLVSEEQRHLFKTPKVSVILNGIDCEAFTSQSMESRTPSSFTIGIVGRLSVEKGHIYLLRAFAKLLESGKRSAENGKQKTKGGQFPSSVIRSPLSLRLLIIGDGPLRARLLEIVHRTKILKGKVRFLPAQKDIKKFYDQMNVLVLPSLSEGLPMTLLEGMAMELPVVATRVGGIPDVIKDGFNGLLVEPQDVEGLAGAIYKIIEAGRGQSTVGGQPPDAPLSLSELTTNARETVELHFSTQRMAAEYLNVYRNL